MYDLFKVKNVMDFSMGWGDRLAGFFASQNTELYVGVDPRKENHPIYREQADYYEGQLTMFETMKKVDFYCEAAEDFYYDGYDDTLILYSHHHLILMWKDIVTMTIRVGLDTRILIVGILSSYIKLLTICYRP